MINKTVLLITFGSILSGCGMQSPLATSKEASRTSIGILCNRYVNFPPSDNFHMYAKEELQKRGIDLSSCLSMDQD